MTIENLTESNIWQQLTTHQQQLASLRMLDLFEKDPQRFARMSLHYDDILLDYSKNLITDDSLSLLFELARQCDVEGQREAMFAGEKINTTEHRAVLHTALRNKETKSNMPVVQALMSDIQHELNKMQVFSEQVRSGTWLGFSGKKITDIINIGVGGSYLGPCMVTTALKAYQHPELNMHFIANIDSACLRETMDELQPETTLIIITSKTFLTQETMVNANVLKEWLLTQFGNELALAKHFVAVTANSAEAIGFGVAANNVFNFWDWVGGRYSLWSAVGLPIALAIGMNNFKALLNGAYSMDEHFRTAPLEKNMPVILALLGIWYRNFFDAQTHAILPYSERLQRLPAYLQQLDMESNGKSTQHNGVATDYATGAIIWGELGINGQHAFYQLLHQGTTLIPCDFLISAHPELPNDKQHDLLLANFFAQTEALMKGEGQSDTCQEERQQHEILPGNRPSNSIIYKTLTPETLGHLISLYEHKTFVQGAIWNINSFDQCGVELGKQLAKTILSELNQAGNVNSHDDSTNGLINWVKNIKS